MELSIENEEKIECGRIFISIDSSTSKGKIIVSCLFCDEKFNVFTEYANHLVTEHYPQIELEDVLMNANYQNMQEWDMLKSKKHHGSIKTNDYTTDVVSDIHTLLETYVESSQNGDQETENLLKVIQNESVVINERSHEKFIKNKKCPHCARQFFLSSSLKFHLERHRKKSNSIGGLYKCNICNAEFDLKMYLTVHMNEHQIVKNDQSPLQAVHSEKKNVSIGWERKTNFSKKAVFTKSTTLDVTSRISDVEVTQSNNVDNMSNPSNASEHGDAPTYKALNSTVEPEEVHCKICEKNFVGQSRFNAHMNRHKPCEFKCTICFKEFKTAGELQTHTRFHTGERPYLCSSCGETFATVSKLINHTRRHHTFERTKQCPICKKKFYASGELKVHLQSTHSNARPYQCKLCSSTFNRPFSLRTHMKSHENKREYKCNFCPANFNQKCNLTAHKKKAHCLLIDDEKREEKYILA